MYDIFDDEIDEMYENKGKAGIKLGKGISPKDPLESLTQKKYIVLKYKTYFSYFFPNLLFSSFFFNPSFFLTFHADFYLLSLVNQIFTKQM